MTEKVKKYRQLWLVLPIAFCIAVIVFGGANYMSNLRASLTEQSIDNVLAVTLQQQIAFDNFIAADQERLHSYADVVRGRHILVVDDIEVNRMILVKILSTLGAGRRAGCAGISLVYHRRRFGRRWQRRKAGRERRLHLCSSA